jgi:hypothetical protein
MAICFSCLPVLGFQQRILSGTKQSLQKIGELPAPEGGCWQLSTSDVHERELDRRTDELRFEQFVKTRSRSPS